MEVKYLIVDLANSITERNISQSARVINYIDALLLLDLNKYDLIAILFRSSDKVDPYTHLKELNIRDRQKCILLTDNIEHKQFSDLISLCPLNIFVSKKIILSAADCLSEICRSYNKVDRSLLVFEKRNLVKIRDRRIKLTDQEACLLRVLQSQDPKRPEQIMTELRSMESSTISIESTRISIWRLNKKIQEQTGLRLISNIYGKGYFVKDPTPLS